MTHIWETYTTIKTSTKTLSLSHPKTLSLSHAHARTHTYTHMLLVSVVPPVVRQGDSVELFSGKQVATAGAGGQQQGGNTHYGLPVLSRLHTHITDSVLKVGSIICFTLFHCYTVAMFLH